MRHNRASAPDCSANAAPSSTPIPRSKRPYDTLRPTQKWERRTRAQQGVAEVLQRHGVPHEAIQPRQEPSSADVLHLTTAERERFRTVPHVHLPCEQTIAACKQQLAASHATETGTFAGGAYITDPVRFVSVLCAQSSLLVVGGDTGDGLTKLGVTYLPGGG